MTEHAIQNAKATFDDRLLPDASAVNLSPEQLKKVEHTKRKMVENFVKVMKACEIQSPDGQAA